MAYEVTRDLAAYRNRSGDEAWRKARALEDYVRQEALNYTRRQARGALWVAVLCFGAAAAIVWAVLS